MLNPLNFISKFIKSSNQKELDRLKKIVLKINQLEQDFSKLKDSQFPEKTREYKSRLKNGEDLNKILPEAFACVREASKRTIKERT